MGLEPHEIRPWALSLANSDLDKAGVLPVAQCGDLVKSRLQSVAIEPRPLAFHLLYQRSWRFVSNLAFAES